MTEKEYLDIYRKYPDPYTDSKYHAHYTGEEEDYKKLVEYNKQLIEEYPFLLPRNRWNGLSVEDYDYSFTELDSMPDGWRIAFGLKMMEEIKQALLKAQEEDPNGGYEESWITTNYDSDKKLSYLEGFRIVDIKEKFGQLRMYCGSAPQDVYDIIYKYEQLSWDYCIDCGKPSEYISKGWISPYCDECAHKQLAEEVKIYEEPITIDELFELKEKVVNS